MSVHVRPLREPMRPRGWFDRHGMIPRKANSLRARQPRPDTYKAWRRK